MVRLTKTHFLSVIKNKEIEIVDAEIHAPEMFEILKELDFDDDGFIQGADEKNALWKALDKHDKNGDSESIDYAQGQVFSAVGLLANIASNLAKDEDVIRIETRDAQKAADVALALKEAERVSSQPAPSISKAIRAVFTKTRKVGKKSQMKSGTIKVNGNTYNFNSGGSGNGNLPAGEYTVTPHRWKRYDNPSMMVAGVGYSFALNDKYDSRVGKKRTLLRIHPDGRGRGTAGCIGITGGKRIQQRFREDMRAELKRQGGSFKLIVG